MVLPSLVEHNNNPQMVEGISICYYLGKSCISKFHDFCLQQTHTPARACARHRAKHRDTTVSPTYAYNVAFREMSSAVSTKYYCLSTRCTCNYELQATYRPTLAGLLLPSCLIVGSLLGSVWNSGPAPA